MAYHPRSRKREVPDMADLYRRLSLLFLVLLGACAEPPAPPNPVAASSPSIDDFFQRFTDEWVRRDPNLAVLTSYFEGEEQDRLSRELTPVSRAYELETIELARTGLAELATFDRDALTPGERLSADIMRWQLESVVDNELYLDYGFPLEQHAGRQRAAAEPAHRRATRSDGPRRRELRRTPRPIRRADGRSRRAQPASSRGRRGAAAVHFDGDDRTDAALRRAASRRRTRSSRRCAKRWRASPSSRRSDATSSPPPRRP